LSSQIASSQERPVTDCDIYAASNLDPGKRGPGILPTQIDVAKAIPACVEAIEKYPNDARLEFQLGRSYFQDKQYDAAAIWYKKSVEKTFVLSENNLGAMYAGGLGVSKDPSSGAHIQLTGPRRNSSWALTRSQRKYSSHAFAAPIKLRH